MAPNHSEQNCFYEFAILNTMKIYVAARFHDKEKVKEIYTLLKQNGHEISADWTWHTKFNPYSKHVQEVKSYATEDIEGIKNCDVFILLTSKEAGAGSSTELGAALSLTLQTDKPKIYVIGEYIDENMFFFHPAVKIRKNVNEVLKEIKTF